MYGQLSGREVHDYAGLGGPTETTFSLGGGTHVSPIERSDRTSSESLLGAAMRPAAAIAPGSEGGNFGNVIANMHMLDAAASQRPAERPPDEWGSRLVADGSINSFEQRAAAARNAADAGGWGAGIRGGRNGAARGPDRRVIASIEAVIMRMEEEQSHYGPGGAGRSGATHGSRQMAGMSQREALGIMMAQQ